MVMVCRFGRFSQYPIAARDKPRVSGDGNQGGLTMEGRPPLASSRQISGCRARRVTAQKRRQLEDFGQNGMGW